MMTSLEMREMATGSSEPGPVRGRDFNPEDREAQVSGVAIELLRRMVRGGNGRFYDAYSSAERIVNFVDHGEDL